MENKKNIPEHIRAEWAFLFFAIPYGIILLFLVPPLGGNDEGFHFQRTASIAYLQPFNQKVSVPAGVRKFIEQGSDFFKAGLMPPFGYSWVEFEKVQDITLDKEHSAVLEPNYFTVHHPFCYLPQVMAFQAGIAAGFSPLVILYICRAASLMAGIILTLLAIRIIPSHKYLLSAFALLPGMVFYRSAINPDCLATSLSFLFCALLFKAMSDRGEITPGNLILIGCIGFILAQCKNAYLPLLFLMLAIPKERFVSNRFRTVSLFAVILPAILASAAWIVISKQTFFNGIGYHTWAGEANPDAQIGFIVHNPMAFLNILCKTVFTTPLVPIALLQMAGDIGPGNILPIPIIFTLIYSVAGTALSEKNLQSPIHGYYVRLLAAGIALVSFILILVLLYIHWTGVAAESIKGFNGRYLYPLLPLLIPFIKPTQSKIMTFSASTYLLVLGGSGLTGTVWQIIMNYY